jgi:protein translocase SecG subunit
MKTALTIINIIVACLIVVLILMQGKGAGLGSAWGGGGELFQTRRGIEKITLRLTSILIVVFFVISLISFFSK